MHGTFSRLTSLLAQHTPIQPMMDPAKERMDPKADKMTTAMKVASTAYTQSQFSTNGWEVIETVRTGTAVALNNNNNLFIH